MSGTQKPLACEISEEAAIAPAVEAAQIKLTSSKLAQKLGIKTSELIERLVEHGLLELREGKPFITAKGEGFYIVSQFAE